MTECNRSTTDQIEAYMLGDLPEDDATRFEEHYFDCPVCLAQVEALQAVQRRLRTEPVEAVTARGQKPNKVISWPVRITALAAIAAALLIGFFAFRTRFHPAPSPQVASIPTAPDAGPKNDEPPASASRPAEALTQLAELTLPPFETPNLRGQSGSPLFASGMKAYSAHDCPAAIKALAHVPSGDEDALAAHFYSGVCLIQSGDMSKASQSLRSVAAAGDTPQQEAAFFYLAQIALAQGDSSAARHYLGQTVSVHGDFEHRARAQLLRLRTVDSGK